MITAHSKIIIIFSGYNQRAVIAFIRTLERHRLEYAIIARSANDSILLSAYKDRVAIVRETDRLDLELIHDYIKRLKQRYGFSECMIAPSTEALNRLLVKERATLAKDHVIVPLCRREIYCQVSDKHSFGELCRKHHLLIPEEYDSVDNAPIPFVAKPKQYLSESGMIAPPYLIMGEHNKTMFKDTQNASEFYYQEFVQGDSLYLLYYFHRNGSVFKYSQKNLLQQADGKSIIAAIPSTLHDQAISNAYEILFEKIGFHGLVMVEIKHNSIGDYMIEANPRFWGPSQLFVDAGINLFEALLHDYGYIQCLPNKAAINPESTYFWYRGLQESYSMDKEPVSHTETISLPITEIDKWLSYDIYNRPDTIDIFKGETQ